MWDSIWQRLMGTSAAAASGTSTADEAWERAPDVFAAGLFPLSPATHDIGLSRLFDLATLLMVLGCHPGDTVLDLGAGSGFASEMLARVGYDVVAIDPDRPALINARRRVACDRARIDGAVHTVQAEGTGLPLRAASVDGVLGMNVLHHIADLPHALDEMAHVLRPGGRAVFVEPGLDHLTQNETQRAIREHGENDQAFDALRFLDTARAHGFQNGLLATTLHPALGLLPIGEVPQYLAGAHPQPQFHPAGMIHELHHHHPFCVLIREGTRPFDSRHPGVLKATLTVADLPMTLTRGEACGLRAQAVNLGDTLWRSAQDRRGGFVSLGCKLTTAEGRMIDDALGRTRLPADVAPGGTVAIEARLTVPAHVPPGLYRLHFDLVNELRCWFSDLPGNTPVTWEVTVR